MMKESKGSEDIVMRRRGTSSHPSATRGRVSKVVGMERVWRCGGVVVCAAMADQTGEGVKDE
jgi:hypothetical protein